MIPPGIWGAGSISGEGPSDPHFASVIALLHFDGADGSTSMIDVTGRLWAADSNAELDTAQAKFGPSSLLSTGSASSVTHNQALLAGEFSAKEDFTVEAWVRVPNLTGIVPIFSNAASDTSGMKLGLLNGRPYFQIGTSPVTFIIAAAALSIGQWHHIAGTLEGTSMRLFSGGVEVADATLTAAPNDSIAQPQIAGDPATSMFLNGHVDDFRFTQGVARYISGFAPPTLPFPDM